MSAIFDASLGSRRPANSRRGAASIDSLLNCMSRRYQPAQPVLSDISPKVRGIPENSGPAGFSSRRKADHGADPRLAVCLPKGRSISSHLGWGAPKQAAKGPIHVALVAKTRLKRDIRACTVGLAQ